MNILNLNLVDNGIDQKVIELLSKSMPQEDLEKALNRSGLVQRIIQVKTKHGIVNRKQWVRASELKQPEKPRKKTAVEIEELAIEGAKLPKIYGKTIRDLTPQQIEDLNNIAVPRARMTALKNLIGEEGSTKWALELGLKWKRHPDSPEQDWKNARRAIKRYFIAGNKIHVPDDNAKADTKKEEPKNTEPKVDDTKKDPNVKPIPFDKRYTSYGDIPKDAVKLESMEDLVISLHGKTLTLLGTTKDIEPIKVFQDDTGNKYQISSFEFRFSSYKLSAPTVSTHVENKDGKTYAVTTYTFNKDMSFKDPPKELRDFEKVDASVLEPNKTMAGVKASKPMRFEYANSGAVNPHIYDGKSEKERETYTINCQTSVMTFEARLRGYNVEAKPYVVHQKTNLDDCDKAMRRLSLDTTYAWDKKQRADLVKYTRGRVDHYKWLNKTIKKGERYHLYYYYKGKVNGYIQGHIVTAYKNADGDVVIYDPQTGVSSIGELQIKRHFEGTTQHTMYRVDNLKFNFDVMNKIVRESKNENK